MSLPVPNLDDRSFDQLVEEARRRIQQASPEWTDLSPGDPGIVLLELFAYLTETMLYRLNRLPEKAYIEFLNLIGVKLHPPAAASVMLRFTRTQPADRPLEIPRGTRVTASRASAGSEVPVFLTSHTLTLAAGELTGEVLAHHGEVAEGELIGRGTGQPSLSLLARRPPIVAPSSDELDLVVGVEVLPDELEERAPVIQYGGKLYRIWREVGNFANLGTERLVYLADRATGRITFAPTARMVSEAGGLTDAPQALAGVPPIGREIRLWYRFGGGPAGNVAATMLTVLKQPIPGVAVTNPAPATGGQAGETLDNALLRGSQELHSLRRAVTARDFELVALTASRAVARAKALTQAALWAHAPPGTVEVLLVPHVPDTGRVTVATLREQETEVARAQVQHALEERRPLGIVCAASWARYKTVRVVARVVVRREADQALLRERILERLHLTLNPLPTRLSETGWPFGQALRASHVYDVALAEPGVLWVDRVRLMVEEVPDRAVASVVADRFQARAWYAGSGATLFRSLNDGDGWEPAGHFAGEEIEVVRVHPDRAGLLAVATRVTEGESRLHLSTDMGESWGGTPFTVAFGINDMAWLLREREPILLLATDAGLYELSMRSDSSPVQLLVESSDQNLGFYAVVASRDVRGQVSVAVAAQRTVGVFLSSEGGKPNSFRSIGLRGEDIRVLAVQDNGPRSFLWAGAATAGGEDPGKGCFRWELRGSENPPDGWRPFSKEWRGGSCRGLAFLGMQVMAASHRAGVLLLASAESDPAWQTPDVRCGLPLRDPGRFQPVATVAADPAGTRVLAGGSEGLFRSADQGVRYEPASRKEFSDKVTLPPTWLFCSGEHEVVIRGVDEAERD